MPLLTKENKDGRRTDRADRNGRSDPAGLGVRYVEDVAVSKLSTDLLIDNAATASQNRTLIDDPVTREAIDLNVAVPLLSRIVQLEHALRVIDALDPESNIQGCSEHAARGLVNQMGRVARNVLND